MIPPEVPYDGDPPKGDACVAVKRALSRAGYMMWGDFTPIWGHFAQRACSNFQHAHKLTVSGKYTEGTHNTLVKTHRAGSTIEWAFDAYSIALMQQAHITPEEEARFKILDGVTWSIIHQAMIDYQMVRPFVIYPSFPVPHRFWNDCSGMFAQWYRWGNAPDPHNNDYSGIGNTATLWNHGTPVSDLKSAQLCDAVLYGEPTVAGAAAHVVLLRRYTAGAWYAGSHGTESGPNEVIATYRPIVGIRRFPLV